MTGLSPVGGVGALMAGSTFCGQMTPPLGASLSLKFSEFPGCEQPRLTPGADGCADAAAAIVRINKAVTALCAIRCMGKKRPPNGSGSQTSELRTATD